MVNIERTKWEGEHAKHGQNPADTENMERTKYDHEEHGENPVNIERAWKEP